MTAATETFTMTATQYAIFQQWKAARQEYADADAAREKSKVAHGPEAFQALMQCQERVAATFATWKAIGREADAAFGDVDYKRIARQEAKGAKVVAA